MLLITMSYMRPSSLKDSSDQPGRWSLKLQGFDFTVMCTSGKRHLDADGLSRRPLFTRQCSAEDQEVLDNVAVPDTIHAALKQHRDSTL